MMEEHRIKLKIADRTYSNVISSDAESEVRRAAKTINEKIADFTRKYPKVSVIDILTIIALNESIEKHKLQDKLDKSDEDIARLCGDLKNYVDSMK